MPSVAAMEHCRPAERAVVAALALGLMDVREFAGRLHPADFTDPAAGECFAAALEAPLPVRSAQILPELLRRRGRLRGDGYPVRELLEWLPLLPAPVHPEAWATLIVAGSLGRVMQAAGLRLEQVATGVDPRQPDAGRVLTMAAAQRATLHGALRRWESLPDSWRASVPDLPMIVPNIRGAATAERPDVEQEVIAGVLAAPTVLGEVRWLLPEDFTDARCGEVFGVAQRLFDEGRPVDSVTVSVASAPLPGTGLRGPGSFERLSAGAGPAAVPFLARRLLASAAVREAQNAGRDLIAIAGAPASVGGIGAVQLHAALDRLEALKPYARRLEESHRCPPSRALSQPDRARPRVAGPRPMAALDRRTG
jgi:hypothetical protein